jgi:ubiquinone/menaquinone biosynthesis C-methylase UbiE
MDPYERMKEQMKWLWSQGDYREVAPRLEPYAQALAVAAGIRSGMEVLDVAAGNGNFAAAAARCGARVTASDVTPQMLALGRARTADEGLTIEWLEADAQELPFDADRFDVVASVFGAMFAPRPERVAAELFRVTKPGGVVAMANYGSGGFLATFSGLFSRYVPPPAVELPSPFAWGDPAEVRRRFEGLAAAIEIETRSVTFKFASLDEGWAFWERTNPLVIALRTMLLPERHQQMREEGRGLMREMNPAKDGRLILDSAYLQVVAHRRA